MKIIEWIIWTIMVGFVLFLVGYTIYMYKVGDIGAFLLVAFSIVYAYMVKLMVEVLGELLRGEPWI